MIPKVIDVNGVKMGGNNPLVLIAGPCVIEGENLVMHTAEEIKKIADKLNIPFIFKSSYAKDNRSSVDYYYGPGVEEGTKILERVKKTFNVPVLSDVHYPDEVKIAAEVLDIIQLPAFLSMQTRLTLEVARTGKVINIKKSQYLAPQDVKNIIRKIESTGNTKILLTERGTFFGYHNLIVDMRSLKIMRDFGYPVIFDVTHTVRIYGIPSSNPVGGNPEFIFPLARAGVAAGIDAVFIETHPNPSTALSDASSMLPLNQLEALLIQLIEIDKIVKAYLYEDYH
ncbi:MAG TPA: 3-deoxy-8-phosphooctulonate synthase [Candidatus Hydrothermia bacterium]|nr:3-deoxy-8-phosphooctulonate synthase [Candidatus Hydrothermae bacterium]MDD3649341.1 3-deoxy-8-phosphooctulonate synthase [Candidatus Hydrothermia bacterium]MDD5572563.1 3-deoxy-8-phosphooctulonate synthase [Candidatus Hydrothermia bacterium]HRD23295.1 3-deoxy-8-phosphooctulonate synthase [Candidatus Hydrothermia bacterium]